jgi:hypothetical protein
VICGDEQDPVEQEGDVDAVDIMVLLLADGLPDDTVKEVGCCVDVSNGALGVLVIHRNNVSLFKSPCLSIGGS